MRNQVFVATPRRVLPLNHPAPRDGLHPGEKQSRVITKPIVLPRHNVVTFERAQEGQMAPPHPHCLRKDPCHFLNRTRSESSRCVGPQDGPQGVFTMRQPWKVESKGESPTELWV